MADITRSFIVTTDRHEYIVQALNPTHAMQLLNIHFRRNVAVAAMVANPTSVYCITDARISLELVK